MDTPASVHASPSTRPSLATGIACGAGAGALWGLVFLAPELAGEFNPLQLTIGRYLAYGAIAALLLAPRWRSLSNRIKRHHWRHLVWLALAGNTLYYLLLSGAVQMGGIAMTSLVIGFLPVAVTVIGSREHGAVPLAKLAPSLLMCGAGALCIGGDVLAASSTRTAITGLLCAVGALVSWTAFAIGNARSLKRMHEVSPHDWNLLTGLMTGAQSLLLLPVALAMDTPQHAWQGWMKLAGVSLGVALLASIAGNALWNRMSRLLPLTLVGQMILFETVFALIYGFAWEQRLPTPWEIAALAFVVMSVVSCLAAHRRTAPMATPAPV